MIEYIDLKQIEYKVVVGPDEDWEDSHGYPRGFLTETWYAANFNGHPRHRENGPAFSVMTPDTFETIQYEWSRLGEMHRVGGPAFMKIQNGIQEHRWVVEGAMHRNEGPARSLLRLSDGLYLEEHFYHYGQLHREDGPAVIKRNPKSGEVSSEAWYHFGRRVRHPTHQAPSHTPD